MTVELKVDNLPSCTEEQLQAIFEPFGIISKVSINSGTGKVTFEEEEDCLAAVENMNGYEYFGNYLKVKALS